MRKIYEGKKYWLLNSYVDEKYRLQPCIVLSADNTHCTVKMLCDNSEIYITIEWLQSDPEKLKQKYNTIMKQFKKQGNKHNEVVKMSDKYLNFLPSVKDKYVVKIDEYSAYVKGRISNSKFVKLLDSNGYIFNLDKEWIEE